MEKDLARATELKGKPEGDPSDFATQEVEPPVGDFVPEVQPTDPLLTEIATTGTGDPAPLISMPADEIAELFIGAFEMVMVPGLEYLHRLAMFPDPEDRKALRRLASFARQKKRDMTSAGKKEIVISEDDLELLDKYEEHEEYKAELPLKEREIEFVKKPLVELIQKANWQFTPEGAIVIAGVAIALPRVGPLIGVYAEKLIRGDE